MFYLCKTYYWNRKVGLVWSTEDERQLTPFIKMFDHQFANIDTCFSKFEFQHNTKDKPAWVAKAPWYLTHDFLAWPLSSKFINGIVYPSGV